MDISINQQNFGMKYLKTQSLVDIANYAVKKGKFDKLNEARKNVDKHHLLTRIGVDICYTNQYPTVVFSRYKPAKDVVVATNANDYELVNRTEIISPKVMDPLKYALNLLIRMGKSAPKNNLYKEVVVNKNKNWKDIMI